MPALILLILIFSCSTMISDLSELKKTEDSSASGDFTPTLISGQSESDISLSIEVVADAEGFAIIATCGHPDDNLLTFDWYLDGKLLEEKAASVRIGSVAAGDHTLFVSACGEKGTLCGVLPEGKIFLLQRRSP